MSDNWELSGVKQSDTDVVKGRGKPSCLCTVVILLMMMSGVLSHIPKTSRKLQAPCGRPQFGCQATASVVLGKRGSFVILSPGLRIGTLRKVRLFKNRIVIGQRPSIWSFQIHAYWLC